ncbi:hypothetical protein IJJ27_03255 [bacterium]|nr:hypothetical protein [bacterium]
MRKDQLSMVKILTWATILVLLTIIGHLCPYFALQGRNVPEMQTVQSRETQRYYSTHERAALAAEIAQLPETHPTSRCTGAQLGK